MVDQNGVYESRGPCANVAMTQVIVYGISIFLTWYRVWWATILGLIVAIVGVVATKEPTDFGKLTLVSVYYYGNAAAVGMHAVAWGTLLFCLFRDHVMESTFDSSDYGYQNEFGSVGAVWVFYIFLMIVVFVHMALALLGAVRARNFREELLQNSDHGMAYTQLPDKAVDV